MSICHRIVLGRGIRYCTFLGNHKYHGILSNISKLQFGEQDISHRHYGKKRRDEIKDKMLDYPFKDLLNSQNELVTAKGEVYDNKPFKFLCEKGKTYNWCSCGLSHNQPFCDHPIPTCTDQYATWKTELRPVYFVAPETKEYWFCNCKQTKMAPFCDGTHKSQKVQDEYKEKTQFWHPTPKDDQPA